MADLPSDWSLLATAEANRRSPPRSVVMSLYSGPLGEKRVPWMKL